MRVKSDWELMRKVSVKVECNASDYGEILVIFITEKQVNIFWMRAQNFWANRLDEMRASNAEDEVNKIQL